MQKVFLDANVILDFFLDREPFSKYSGEILMRCQTGKLQAYTSAVIVSNLYYILRKTAPQTKVIEGLKNFMQITEIVVTSKEMIIEALNSDFRDFEDALQSFSADAAGKIDVILTRNTKDFKESKLLVMTPENYLKQYAI